MSSKGRTRLGTLSALFAAVLVVSGPASRAQSDMLDFVDTALLVAVDISNSVDEKRYRLQMEGIAKALEDPSVLKAIFNGPQGGILFSMMVWSDRPNFIVPWKRISNEAEAKAVARTVRNLPHQSGEFTCLSKMLRNVSDKIIPQLPAQALRVVVDVSGDGQDNCNPKQPVAMVRDELVSYGVTINGLPILEGEEAETLEAWYHNNVKGGGGGFVLPAAGYDDFGRAIRQKFVIEISDAAPQGVKAARLAR